MPPATGAGGEETARNAGRGGVAVLFAKSFFIVIGLVQQTLLPQAIGLAGYGALSRVLAVASVVNNVVVSSSIQGVSRAVARARGLEHEALRATLRVHVPLALALAALFAAFSPLVARFEAAPQIATPLAAAAGVVALYGVYAPLVGMLNGRAQFTRQAGLDMTFAILRTAGLLGMGWIFLRRGLSGALGSILGFVLAAACIVPLAARRAGTGRAGGAGRAEVPSPRAYLAELLPLALAQLATNVLMQVDLTILGRFLSKGAMLVHGWDRLAQEKAADEWVGVYRACQLFAFLPYQLLFSVTQVLFPMLARAKAEGDKAAIARYVARGSRIAMIACGLMVSVTVILPRHLLAFAYGWEVAYKGAGTLPLVSIGQGAFAMIGIATTVLASLGRERTAAIITAVACGGVGAACFAAVPVWDFGEVQLATTALATTSALALALIAAAVAVHRTAGAFVPMRTAIRVLAAVTLAFGASLYGGNLLPFSHARLGALALAPLVALAYGLLLALTGEFGPGDVADIRAVLARRRG